MEGVLQSLNRPKALVIVVVIAFIINGLLFYRYQHNLSEALAAGPSLEGEPSAVATAAPTSFAVPAGQKEPPSAKEAGGKKKGILATALGTLGLDRSLGSPQGSPQGSSQIPYVPLSHLSAGSPQETYDTQAGTDLTEVPATEEVAPASNRTADKPAAEEAASAESGPASVPDQKVDAAPRERLREAPRVAPPAPDDDSPESADDGAPNGTLRETAPKEEETAPKKDSTEGEAALSKLPPDEKPDPPSAPAEQPGPPLAPKSQAQCTDGGFAVFGFENEDECLRFVAPQDKSDPAKGKKD